MVALDGIRYYGWWWYKSPCFIFEPAFFMRIHDNACFTPHAYASRPRLTPHALSLLPHTHTCPHTCPHALCADAPTTLLYVYVFLTFIGFALVSSVGPYGSSPSRWQYDDVTAHRVMQSEGTKVLRYLTCKHSLACEWYSATADPWAQHKHECTPASTMLVAF